MQINKNTLRDDMRAKIKSLKNKAVLSRDIVEQISNMKEYREASVVAVFRPILSIEPDIADLLEDNKKFIFPSDELYDFEPSIVPDIVLIPALAVDKNMNRLGKGGGWYDRVLKKYSNAYKIAVVFDIQVINEQIPTDDMDVKMNKIVTN